MPNKPITWKACQEALDAATKRVAQLEHGYDVLRMTVRKFEHERDALKADLAAHTKWGVFPCKGCQTKNEEIARLKAAAAGQGMVSEMADMEEVAVLVVGLHDRIALVEQERNALHADLDLQIKRTEEARNERDVLREKLHAIRNSPVDTPADA